MNRQRNDRGFSLVELIVVILIMGIIAVSLAPQVMKWVGKSKEGTDLSNRDLLKSVAQVAVAAYESTGVQIEAEDYNVKSTGITSASGSDPNGNLSNLIEEALGGEYPKVLSQKGKIFQIKIQTGAAKIEIDYVDGSY